MRIRAIYDRPHGPTIACQDDFRALLHLQAELIRLQGWVVRHNEKVIVIFEGRDSAGKGGVIKRIA